MDLAKVHDIIKDKRKLGAIVDKWIGIIEKKHVDSVNLGMDTILFFKETSNNDSIILTFLFFSLFTLDPIFKEDVPCPSLWDKLVEEIPRLTHGEESYHNEYLSIPCFITHICIWCKENSQRDIMV
jgi:hypothetical protein